MAKPEKIMKPCRVCKGKGVLSDAVARQLPNPPAPGKKVQCPSCKGKKFEFRKPEK